MDVLHRGIEGVADSELVAYERNSLAAQQGGDSVASYDSWAVEGSYELHLNSRIYRGPEVVAERIERYYRKGLIGSICHDVTGTKVTDRADISILDIAAGTGLVADRLKKFGYNNIHALDPSIQMLKLAEKKQVYRKYINGGIPISRETVPDCSYEVITSSGGMGEGHIPVEGIDDMYRMAKVGGIIVVVMRTEYIEYVEMYKDKLRPRIKHLIDTGCWTPIEDNGDEIGEISIEDYSFHKRGSLFSYRKLK